MITEGPLTGVIIGLLFLALSGRGILELAHGTRAHRVPGTTLPPGDAKEKGVFIADFGWSRAVKRTPVVVDGVDVYDTSCKRRRRVDK